MQRKLISGGEKLDKNQFRRRSNAAAASTDHNAEEAKANLLSHKANQPFL